MRGKIEFQTLSQSLIGTAKLRINASVRVGQGQVVGYKVMK